MTLNRVFFYEQLHDSLFPKGIKQSQVDGMEAILDYWDSGFAANDDRWLAYMLATAYHETGRTMQPVREAFATSDQQAIARLQKSFDAGKLAWVKTPYWKVDANGQSWFGRGLVQLTHKANYQTMKSALNVDIVAHPELALEMDVAVKIMFEGMIHGRFTKYKLGDFFDGSKADWFNARKIINALERAKDVASYGRRFYAAISHTL